MKKNKEEEVVNTTDPVIDADLQKKIQEKSLKIAEILKEEPAMALQPFMNINQFGIRPDVALVPVPDPITEPKQE